MRLFDQGLAFALVLAFSCTLSFAASGDWQAQWEKIPASRLPALAPDGDFSAFRLALKRQTENCREYREKKFQHCGTETATFALECDEGVLLRLRQLAKGEKSWKAFYRKAKSAFDWYLYKGSEGKVLFTGYNSPLFPASLKPDARFKYPLYAKPADLLIVKEENGGTQVRRKLPGGSLAPYYDRKAIEVDHVLAGKGLEIAYLESPADVLRLQIEGSGVLKVKNTKGQSKEIGINYAAKNGYPYVSVIQTLKKRGVDKKYLSFPGLRQYFLDQPEAILPTLTASPSYVFFSLASEPPCGSARVHVTGGHSLAVDPSQLPLGMAALVEAERPLEGTDPEAQQVPTKPFTRFAFAQDTGGAIKGAHVDIYWGTGDYAMLASNSMQSTGRLFFPRLKKK